MYFGLLLIIMTIFSICILETLKYVSNKNWTPLKKYGMFQISSFFQSSTHQMCYVPNHRL